MSENWNLRYLKLAKEISTWSKDPARQIGAVAIGDKGQVLAQGYNGFPRGIYDGAIRYNDKAVKHQYVVHAEQNVIYNATYNGVSLDGATLYVWGLPVCNECAKGIIQVGIKKVIMPAMDYPDKWLDVFDRTSAMFGEVGLKYEFIEI